MPTGVIVELAILVSLAKGLGLQPGGLKCSAPDRKYSVRHWM